MSFVYQDGHVTSDQSKMLNVSQIVYEWIEE